jgi:hypothetical protein
MSAKIEDARINRLKDVKRLQLDLESFVMSRVSENPVYRVDLIKRLKAKDQPIGMLNLINDA